jgi:hypothetical protein
MADEVTPVGEKTIFQSKTFYMNVLMALAPAYPPMQLWIAQNQIAFGMIWAALAIVVRFLTKNKVTLSD